MIEFFKKHIKPIAYISFVAVSALLLIIGHNATTGGEQIFGKFANAPVERGKVTELLYDEVTEFGFGSEMHRYFVATVKSGERKGEEIVSRQVQDTLYTVPIRNVQVGDDILICYTPYGYEHIWIFQEYDRSLPLLILLVIFFIMLLIFGGKSGLGTIVSLILTCTCVFYYFIPAILSGQNIYLATILTCIYIVAVTLILVNGFNFKSLSAAVGCFGGLMVSGILFFVMDHFLMLTGMIDEDSAYLTMMGIPFDLKAIIFSSVVIGVLGGVLDVGVSIAAALNEIYPEGIQHDFKKVMASGMNIGRDVMATMTNTLILVYIGSSLSLTLLLTVYSNSIFELINREVITVEILLALLGSMGLLFTIPLCTFFYAFYASRPIIAQKEDFIGDPITLEVGELPKKFRDKGVLNAGENTNDNNLKD